MEQVESVVSSSFFRDNNASGCTDSMLAGRILHTARAAGTVGLYELYELARRYDHRDYWTEVFISILFC